MLQRTALQTTKRSLLRRCQRNRRELPASIYRRDLRHAATCQQQRRRNQQPRSRLVSQPPGQPPIRPQHPPNQIRHRAAIAATNEPARAEIVVGDSVSRPRGCTLDRTKQFDRGGNAPGGSHVSASGTVERSASSTTRPRNPYSSGCCERLTQNTRNPNANAPNASHGLDE